MKQILADITPMGSNNLFVTHYWPDKQTDPPLHYHEDYMLCLTLHVRGQRIMDDAVEDFTEKDLVLINPGTPHRFKRDAGVCRRQVRNRHGHVQLRDARLEVPLARTHASHPRNAAPALRPDCDSPRKRSTPCSNG